MNDVDTRFFQGFLYRLPDDHRDGKAILAALRRGLGKPPGTVPEILKWVIPLLDIPDSDDHRRSREDTYLVVASLFAMHPRAVGARGNFGAHLAQLRAAKGAGESLDKRFEAILQCEASELADHLRHAVSLIRSSGEPIPVDFVKLREDIEYWSLPTRDVQRAWARGFWQGRVPSETDSLPATRED